MIRILTTAIVALACLTGCDDDASLDGLVASHIDRSGLTYVDCGDVHPDIRGCPDPTPEPVMCLVDAFQQCTPARLDVRWITTEGDPIPSTYLVEPGDTGACLVVAYQDHSEDAFKGNYGDVTRFTCSALVTADACIGFQTDACVPTGDWY
jgi:hypothetical protein